MLLTTITGYSITAPKRLYNHFLTATSIAAAMVNVTFFVHPVYLFNRVVLSLSGLTMCLFIVPNMLSKSYRPVGIRRKCGVGAGQCLRLGYNCPNVDYFMIKDYFACPPSAQNPVLQNPYLNSHLLQSAEDFRPFIPSTSIFYIFANVLSKRIPLR